MDLVFFLILRLNLLSVYSYSIPTNFSESTFTAREANRRSAVFHIVYCAKHAPASALRHFALYATGAALWLVSHHRCVAWAKCPDLSPPFPSFKNYFNQLPGRSSVVQRDAGSF